MKLDIDGNLYEIVIERKAGNRNTYIRVKKDLKVHVTTNTFTTNIPALLRCGAGIFFAEKIRIGGHRLSQDVTIIAKQQFRTRICA